MKNELKIYNPSLPIKTFCDASLKDLGTVLEHKYNEHWNTVAFTS